MATPDEKLAHGFQLIREAFEEIKASTRDEVLKRVLSAVSASDGSDVEDSREVVAQDKAPESRSEERLRAPKGTVPRLCDRALSNAHPKGLAPAQIKANATSDYEKMVELSSIRGHLRRFAPTGRYAERDGLWFLGETHEARMERDSRGGFESPRQFETTFTPKEEN